MLYKAVGIIAICASVFLQEIKCECKVNIKNDLARYQPVFLQNVRGRLNLWAPFDRDLEWATGETTEVLCSGPNNLLEANNQVKSDLKCVGNSQFEVPNSPNLLTSADLVCKNRVTGTSVTTTRACTNGGTIVQLGFNVGKTDVFIPYIESCYDMGKGSTRYTKHYLPREASYKAIGSSTDDFKTTGTPRGINPDIWYKVNNQQKRLGEILKSQPLANQYFTKSVSFMARGHLTPDCDAIFSTWKGTTYFYTNAVPQWQQVNNGNWKILEKQTRDLSLHLQSELVIYMGSEQILELPDVNNVLQPITLQSGGKIEVPKWMWKIIKHGNSAIAVVTLNNPFAKSIPDSELLCTRNICAETNWQKPGYSNYGSGFTYCCTVSDLKRKANSVPDEANAPNVLNYPANVVQQNYGDCYNGDSSDPEYS